MIDAIDVEPAGLTIESARQSSELSKSCVVPVECTQRYLVLCVDNQIEGEDSMAVVKAVEKVGSRSGTTSKTVTITDSGEL